MLEGIVGGPSVPQGDVEVSVGAEREVASVVVPERLWLGQDRSTLAAEAAAVPFEGVYSGVSVEIGEVRVEPVIADCYAEQALLALSDGLSRYVEDRLGHLAAVQIHSQDLSAPLGYPRQLVAAGCGHVDRFVEGEHVLEGYGGVEHVPIPGQGLRGDTGRSVLAGLGGVAI